MATMIFSLVITASDFRFAFRRHTDSNPGSLPATNRMGTGVTENLVGTGHDILFFLLITRITVDL